VWEGVANEKNTVPTYSSIKISRLTILAGELMPASLPDASPHERAHRRYRIELEVSLNSDSNFYMGLTQNLSHGGLFVATHVVQPIGTDVDIALRIPTSAGLLALRGTVRWVREFAETLEAPPGMGVEFEELSEEASRVIAEFLATRTPLFFEIG
jgi:uncharacterized protein (TIGR02266 family)